MTHFYAVDASGVTRLTRRFFAVDPSGISRMIKRGFVIDPSGAARLFFIGGYSLTITAGTISPNTGYSNSGGGGGTYGSISAPAFGSLPSGKFVEAVLDNTAGFGAALVISNMTVDPGQSSLVEIILNGRTLTGSSASYLHSGTQSTWNWPGSLFGLVNGNTYSGFIISSGAW